MDPHHNDKAYVIAVARLLVSRNPFPTLVGRFSYTCRFGKRVSTNAHLSKVWQCNPRLHVLFPDPAFFYVYAGMLSFRLSTASSLVSVPLSSLTPKSAVDLGQSFGLLLAGEVTADNAVSLYLSQNVALAELAARHPAFKDLAVAIGRRKLMVTPWGMAMRVAMGAGISILDMYTDVGSVVRFFNEGRTGFAGASLFIVLFCMLFHFVFCYLQVRRQGCKKVLSELALVLLCLMPAADAYRVISGEEAHEHALLSPFLMMMLLKLGEM